MKLVGWTYCNKAGRLDLL